MNLNLNAALLGNIDAQSYFIWLYYFIFLQFLARSYSDYEQLRVIVTNDFISKKKTAIW